MIRYTSNKSPIVRSVLPTPRISYSSDENCAYAYKSGEDILAPTKLIILLCVLLDPLS
jgi:hypothetical protein